MEQNITQSTISPHEEKLKSELIKKAVTKRYMLYIVVLLLIVGLIILGIYLEFYSNTSRVTPTSNATIPESTTQSINSAGKHLSVTSVDQIQFQDILDNKMHFLSPNKVFVPTFQANETIVNKVSVNTVSITFTDTPAPQNAINGLYFGSAPISHYTQTYDEKSGTLLLTVYLDSLAISNHPNSFSMSGTAWNTIIIALWNDLTDNNKEKSAMFPDSAKFMYEFASQNPFSLNYHNNGL